MVAAMPEPPGPDDRLGQTVHGGTRHRQRLPLTRQTASAFLVALLGSLTFTVGSISGSAALARGDWRSGWLLFGVSGIGLTTFWLAGCFAYDRAGRLPSILAKPLWLGVPRYVWIVGGAGGLFTLSFVANALLY